jgi:acyl dehydratase
MAITCSYKVGDELPPLAKTMTQEAINAFEKSGGAKGPSQFTDLETARSTLGTGSTVASGRMSLTFTIEMLRRYFGADVYNAGGMVDMRFLRPVRPGACR